MEPVVPSDVTICAPLWGDYWERWGEPKWLPQMLALNPQPYEFLILSDKPVDGLNKPFRVVVEPEVCQRTWLGLCSKHVRTRLMMGCGMDDGMPPDALQDLVFGGDITFGPIIASDGQTYTPTQQGWDNFYDEPWYPLSGWWLCPPSLFERIKMREVEAWDDWIYFLECKSAGIKPTFDTKVRNFYTHHADQYSRNRPKNAIDIINQMKQIARKGGIIPGTCWPPETTR
jgi:hypothetical protein